jgi:hypothetical protein
MADSLTDSFEHYTHCDAAIDDDGMPCTCGAERAKAAWNAAVEACAGNVSAVADAPSVLANSTQDYMLGLREAIGLIHMVNR